MNRAISIAFALSVLVGACANDDSSDAGATSDGALFDADVGTCALRSDAAAYGGYPTAEALPSGACDNEPSCILSAWGPCPSRQGPLNGYYCMCAQGQWSCSIFSQGTSICADGGADVNDPD